MRSPVVEIDIVCCAGSCWVRWCLNRPNRTWGCWDMTFLVPNIKKEERWQNKKGCWEETPVFSSSYDALTLNNMSTKSFSIFRLNWVEKVSFDNLSLRKRSMFIVEASKMARLQPVKKLAFFSLFCRIATLICVVSSCFVRVWLVLKRSWPWDYPFGC